MLHVIIMQLLHLTCHHASLFTPLQLACNVALAADAAACASGAGELQKLGDAQVQFDAAVLAF